MEDYKVKWEDFEGVHVTEWMGLQQAKKFFDGLKGPVLNTVWAELIYSPTNPAAPDEEQVIEQFTNRVIEISGKKVIVK